MYWLSEHGANYLSGSRSGVPRKISPRSIVIVPIQPKISSILTYHFGFPLSLLLVLLDQLILINTVHELTYTPNRFPGQRLSQIMLVGKLTLKVLIATSLKSPSISLNISQYLSEYVFRVSPSCMVIDSREPKGRGTLLQVIERAPKALVSSLKELIEPSFRPSNHLIATGPKLDGNTLHVKASFLEWTVIL